MRAINARRYRAALKISQVPVEGRPVRRTGRAPTGGIDVEYGYFGKSTRTGVCSGLLSRWVMLSIRDAWPVANQFAACG
jgi:hypothetical protein